VSGTLGDAAAGLAILMQQRSGSASGASHAHAPTPTPTPSGDAVGTGSASGRAALIERFLRPSPRVDLGLALAGIASAAIDVSDGLAADLGHLCRASGCLAVVDVECVPLSTELTAQRSADTALAQALGGGDDYELCFTAPPARAERVESAAAAAGTHVHRIGRLVEARAGGGIEWRRKGAPYVPSSSGYLHF
jgi:thiamine-monophosphate kinase